ncbi:hypothetical protein PHYBLDRAFT_66020 [Phycomyces blakesleeanus NRRL 1555(-)]|uniref:Uncharacterized protein n=1 Tax=Phycomyces blakesleeanus (strain ATCC 8743b / DSM 1359 / FGSC 10004 / NBRC 33097 / NRRL 1555) TaxID=763407 RepID=A0A167MNZ7_PHYB8|nr:hypothetical protein PHYBLDRAFT_66020 [Phycomyces blakesleeanus NRRL 1555(-)]OAD73409.1 hypothetical protein PHYBLDRAFT_66020 [Phycomyces blakesleeanus NRRL 1555(-)]|eukprot:XP_018291449.1 hypothetical protein PHYBLDRAFT_66020 [Phycomyces blakesleeanus NRRL 1555(-)]
MNIKTNLKTTLGGLNNFMSSTLVGILECDSIIKEATSIYVSFRLQLSESLSCKGNSTSCRKFNFVEEWNKYQNLTVIVWLSNNPDLSSIGKLWSYLTRRVKTRV